MIKEKIEKFYLERRKDRDRTYFYITEAGRCPRSVWYNFKKFPKKEKDARLMRVFENGDYTHMRIMSSLFSIGAVKAIEVALEEDIVHGRCDGIVVINNEPYVLELKSINSYGFKKLEAPKPEHIKQLMLYLHYFKIKNGIFIYENKDNQDLKEFHITYDKEMAQKLVENFVILRHMVQENILPPVPQNIDEWECRFCDYFDECAKKRSDFLGRKLLEEKQKAVVKPQEIFEKVLEKEEEEVNQ